MAKLFGLLRRRVLAPTLAEVGFAERGFPVEENDATRGLEAIPQSVVCGFEWGIENPSLWELERRLEMVEPELRGFAYEGATMATTILDVMPGGGGGRTQALLRAGGEKHILLAYIGIGFAMSHLPRPLWRKVLPDLSGHPFHPTMSWLAVDGYGFDIAYFHTERWVTRQQEPAPYPWLDCPGYFHRAVDQGIGRALWFINGAVPDAVTEALRAFDPARHADLWSGVGLAATFAGGCEAEGLAKLRGVAGEHADQLGLGSVFATTARVLSGYVPDRTHAAVQALAGMSTDDAVMLSATTAVHEGGTEDTPPYELWRSAIRAGLPGAVPAANTEKQPSGQ